MLLFLEHLLGIIRPIDPRRWPATVRRLRVADGWMPMMLVASMFLLPTRTRSEEANKTAAEGTVAAGKVQVVVERALNFLVEDTAKWRSQRRCATCHHGCMTVWALSEARNQGYVVPAETLAETIEWTKDLFVAQFNKPRDPRWGYNFVSLPGIYLSLASQTLPILSRNEVNQLAVHLVRHQEPDGAWLVPPPNANISPPTWESPETIVLWALLAWEPYVPADPQDAAATRAARDKAIAWLEKCTPTGTTQSLALRLLLDVRTDREREQISSKVDQLLGLQNADGGWSQLKDLKSDAYATGQVLWVLSFAGVKPDHPQVRRAVAFLIGSQQENGSWPMTARYHPGQDLKERFMMPITYFGSAWATLGLVRFLPPPLDVASTREHAITTIRGYSGTYEVDEAAPGKPLTSVSIRVEVDDQQLAKLARLLTAFPELKSLKLSSPHITDAGAGHLKALSQLHVLWLEQAPITDAALADLKTLAALEELNLKGTKVTDAGVEDFQRALPNVKVQR